MGRAIARRIMPEQEAPAQPRPQPRPATPRTPASHAANPNTANFGAAQLTPGARQLHQAILRHPDNKASAGDAVTIARQVDAASRALGVNPRVMLAIIAHESGGFDKNAVSHTGARGLGQLTSIAIQEIRRLSFDPTYDASYRGSSERTHHEDPDVRAVVERPAVQNMFRSLAQSDEARHNITNNIWGSTFYARISMDRASETAGAAQVLGQDGITGNYNGASAAERRAHSAGVADNYRIMFGQTIPATLRPTV